MAKCIDCLHFDVCKHKMEEICKFTKIEDLIHNCSKFTDRTKYVKVVRCKDCTEWDEKEQECKHWYGFRADDFCSYGERKDNG